MAQGRDIIVAEADDIDLAMPVEPAKAAQYLLYAIAGLVILTFLWASVARLDRVTRGQGRVVTSNQLQQVQYLEGGIVEEILVSAGQKVEAGDVLVKLDPTQLNVEFRQGREGYNVLAARIARLEAEAALKDLTFDPQLVTAAPLAVANERKLYEARKAELTASLDVEEHKLDQRRKTLEDAKVAKTTAQQAMDLADQEEDMMNKLVAKGIEPRVELLRAQQRGATARGDYQRADIAVGRIELEIAEAEGEVERVRKTFAASAADDLNKAKAELEKLKEELPALEDKVARTDVRAPVAGTVNRVLVSTIGGVVAPGDTVVEIVPSEDTLLVEAKIKPADIGFLKIGQSAKVSVTAYDSAIYGSMDGVIETISPDAIRDEDNGQWFYNIKVRTSAEAIKSGKHDLKIMPGMAAEVAVLNGKRTVLSYFMNPISKLGDKALRDK